MTYPLESLTLTCIDRFAALKPGSLVSLSAFCFGMRVSKGSRGTDFPRPAKLRKGLKPGCKGTCSCGQTATLKLARRRGPRRFLPRGS